MVLNSVDRCKRVEIGGNLDAKYFFGLFGPTKPNQAQRPLIIKALQGCNLK
jgi:hypothetical protein